MVLGAGSSSAPLDGLRRLVDRIAAPVLVIDLTSQRGCFGNPAAAALMGTSWPFHESLFDLDMAEVMGTRTAARIQRGLTALEEGAISSYEGDRTYRDFHGRPIQAHHSVTRIDLCDAPPVAVGVVTMRTAREHPFQAPAPASALATLDHDWRFDAVSPDVEARLGVPAAQLLGSSLLSLIHPADAADTLHELGRSLEEGPLDLTTRVRAGDGWRSVDLTAGPICRHRPARIGLLFQQSRPTAEPAATPGRQQALEQQLLRIAREVEASGVGAFLPTREDWLAGEDLSPQQSEVTARLLRGESIATIAAGMHLSRSTVRNHLSAVYAKYGVHSQAELIAHLTGRQAPGPR